MRQWGDELKAELAPQERLKRLLLATLSCFALAGVLHQLGLCPIVKRIWMPSWVFFSGGWCFLFMAVLAIYWLILFWMYRRKLFLRI